MLDPCFKDGFAIANPALSGTAMMSVAMIANTFGWEYMQELKANGAAGRQARESCPGSS